MSENAGDSWPFTEVGQLLGEASDPGKALLDRLAGIRRDRGVPACSRLIELLTGLRMDEVAAERAIDRILLHRTSLSAALGRDPGIPLATFDYFINVEPRLRSPRMVEMHHYREIERLAVTDALTGISNRRHFRRSGRSELRRSERYGLSASVLFLDLDDFKDVNDRWGHQLGDRVLVEVARILRGAVRDIDVAARYGGEEFALLLPETPKTGAGSVADRIRGRVEQRFAARELEGHLIGMTISAGVATFPEDAIDLDGLLRRADEALYQAKSAGKNRVVCSIPERRRFHRIDLGEGDGWPTVRVEVPGAGRTAVVRARNLSRGGVLLESAASVAVGDRVLLTMEWHESSSAPIHLSGRVVRSHERDDNGGSRFELGVAFDREGVEALPRLDRMMGRIEEASVEGD